MAERIGFTPLLPREEIPPHPLPEAEPKKQFRCLRHNGCVFHDVFISYRVNTDKKIADKLALLLDTYTKMDGQKIKTFLDSNCLLDGGNWEKNFMSALHHSKLIVMVISEAGLDLPSFSAPGLTKIQNAGNEQDNCLLEYEETLALKEAGKIDILVLCVAQEGKLGGRSCKIKFPTSSARIATRLRMYADSGPHKHRNGEYGPPVEQTMAKLLGLVAASPPPNAENTEHSVNDGDKKKRKGKALVKHAPTYAHLDPDDIPSRIPDILWKLQELEKKDSAASKIWRYFQDVDHFKVKVYGSLIGIFLPFASLLIGLGAISPRQKSLYFGVIVGHGIDFLLASFYTWYKWYIAIPSDCVIFGCNIAQLQTRTDFGSILQTYCNLTKLNATNVVQTTCFCNAWHKNCSDLDYFQDVYMFFGAMLLVISFATIMYANHLLNALATKKYRMRGGV